MKRKYLSFAIGLAVAILIVVALVGCVKQEVPSTLDKTEETSLWKPKLIAVVEDCNVYELNSGDNKRGMYVSVCPVGRVLSLK